MRDWDGFVWGKFHLFDSFILIDYVDGCFLQHFTLLFSLLWFLGVVILIYFPNSGQYIRDIILELVILRKKYYKIKIVSLIFGPIKNGVKSNSKFLREGKKVKWPF